MASKILKEYLENEAKELKIAYKYDGFISENKGMNEEADVMLCDIFMDELTEFIEKKEREKHK